jgi:transcription elongation factor GreA
MEEEKLKITKEKKLELEKELFDLEENKSKQLASDLEDARSDALSDETTVVSRLLEDKKTLDSRIAEIKDILLHAQVLHDNGHKKRDIIELGCEVLVKVGRKTLKFKLVDSIESDPFKNHISDESPLGMKLINSKLGDTISLKLDDKVVEYKILDIC